MLAYSNSNVNRFVNKKAENGRILSVLPKKLIFATW